MRHSSKTSTNSCHTLLCTIGQCVLFYNVSINGIFIFLLSAHVAMVGCTGVGAIMVQDFIYSQWWGHDDYSYQRGPTIFVE